MRTRFAFVLFLLLACPCTGFAEDLTLPEFTSGYEVPSPTRPAPEAGFQDWIDIALLAVTLSLATFLVLRKRSRRGVFWLMLFSIAYFGFWREGCICPFGAIQNVAQALFDPAFILPTAAVAFFLLPLVFTLLFGRSYCAGVCPHGALQDAVLWKPVKLPAWVNHSLGLFAHVYLGLGVLFAATGSAYVICQYDPFVPLFRLSGSVNMLALGGLFLFVSLFVGRPYCRFVCPYGAILRLFSVVSRSRVKIYPDRCIECHLCEDSCPYGAIREATPAAVGRPKHEDKTWMAVLLVILPVLILGGGWLGTHLTEPFARMHATVRLADQLNEKSAENKGELPDEIKAMHRADRSTASVHAEAASIVKSFRTGTWWFGAWIGLVIGVKLIALSMRRARSEYEADRGTCVACARCFDYCPGEKGLLDPEIQARIESR